MLTSKEIIGSNELCTFDSSQIIKSIYTKEIEELIIYFKRGGYYSYKPVPLKLYNDFINTESQGKFFLSNIKNNKLVECFKIGNVLPIDKNNNNSEKLS
jgi:hypothetical protein